MACHHSISELKLLFNKGVYVCSVLQLTAMEWDIAGYKGNHCLVPLSGDFNGSLDQLHCPQVTSSYAHCSDGCCKGGDM